MLYSAPAELMTTPGQTPDTELEVQELTDESLDDVSGGVQVRVSYDLAAAGVDGEFEVDAPFLAGSAFSTTTKLQQM